MAVISAYVVVSNSDPGQTHRIDIPEGKRSESNWYADKVYGGLCQRVDYDHWHIVTEYEGGDER